MAKALSIDLRDRVIRAVASGISRRQAAERFDVSASSAIRWCALKEASGSAAPKRQGADCLSGRIEAHATLILRLVDEIPDITLVALQRQLAGRGIAAGIATLWRFFRRRRITLKKSRRTRPNTIGPTS
jgi:transposase